MIVISYIHRLAALLDVPTRPIGSALDLVLDETRRIGCRVQFIRDIRLTVQIIHYDERWSEAEPWHWSPGNARALAGDVQRDADTIRELLLGTIGGQP